MSALIFVKKQQNGENLNSTLSLARPPILLYEKKFTHEIFIVFMKRYETTKTLMTFEVLGIKFHIKRTYEFV